MNTADFSNDPDFLNDAVRVARGLIERYGLRAAAIAGERAAEAQTTGGGSVQGDHWRSVAMAIAELRRTRPTAH